LNYLSLLRCSFLNLVVGPPGIHLCEICKELRNFLGIDVEESSLIAQKWYNKTKMRITALQRDDFLQQKCINDISVYSTDMFVFLDETRADHRHTSRQYGYSIRGKRPVDQRLLVRRNKSPVWVGFDVC